MLLDGCQGTSMSTEIGDIEHEHELEAEFHIEQICNFVSASIFKRCLNLDRLLERSTKFPDC